MNCPLGLSFLAWVNIRNVLYTVAHYLREPYGAEGLGRLQDLETTHNSVQYFHNVRKRLLFASQVFIPASRTGGLQPGGLGCAKSDIETEMVGATDAQPQILGKVK